MKRIIIILIIVFGFAAVQAQMDNPLKQGMANTVTLSSGEVVYDLTGEWEAVYQNPFYGTRKDIVRIKQEGSKFVGYCVIGNEMARKGTETIKGELAKDGFKSILRDYFDYRYLPSTGKIGEKCNKVVVKTRDETGAMALILTLTRR